MTASAKVFLESICTMRNQYAIVLMSTPTTTTMMQTILCQLIDSSVLQPQKNKQTNKHDLDILLMVFVIIIYIFASSRIGRLTDNNLEK